MRRKTVEVNIGGVGVGGKNPIRIQSMTNTSTNDVEASVNQIVALEKAGAEIVRLTAQGVKEVESLAEIRRQLKDKGCMVPLVADIHFNPAAAFAAARVVDKVRINPGNFSDPGRTFKRIDYTESEYVSQLSQLEDKVKPFYELCRQQGVAIRIGVNHGSLSDRIMSRYGNTPAGMVESAMEFLRIAEKADFHDIVLSIKSSATPTMIATVRLLVEKMKEEGMAYPLHLGVTEAGDGEDGRVKSAVGIATLLYEGIGDTIRVSLSEDPTNEIPVARDIVNHVLSKNKILDDDIKWALIRHGKRQSRPIGKLGGNQPIAVVSEKPLADDSYHLKPDIVGLDGFIRHSINENVEKIARDLAANPNKPFLLIATHKDNPLKIKAIANRLENRGITNPIVVEFQYPSFLTKEQVTVQAAADLGGLVIDGNIDGIKITAPTLEEKENLDLSFGILQGAGARITKTEFIACPGCGRTLFDLSPTLKDVKQATSHLKGLKIGVMGCIVNGPGEMAGADYGYVGAGKGRISLYRATECIEKNIPQEQAVDRLVSLIKRDGKWTDPN